MTEKFATFIKSGVFGKLGEDFNRQEIISFLGEPPSWIGRPPSIGSEIKSYQDAETWLYFNDSIGFVGNNFITNIYFIPSKCDGSNPFDIACPCLWVYEDLKKWLELNKIYFSTTTCEDRTIIIHGELFMFFFPRFTNGIEKNLLEKECLMVYRFLNRDQMSACLNSFKIKI